MVAEQYAHTLIARSNQATPTAAQIQEFVAANIRLGVIPGVPEAVVRVVTGYYEVPSPFGDLVRVPKKKSKPINPEELSNALIELSDFEAVISGQGIPRLPPLPLLKSSPNSYFVGMTVVVSSINRSTSDTYNGFDPPLIETPQFGTPSNADCSTGYFSNLHNGTVIEVQDAGTSRFWIEFELGKFLFPPIVDQLDLLSPTIVDEAKRIFQMDFVQGCHWSG